MLPVIAVNGLKTHFFLPGRNTLKAVDKVSFNVKAGETLGIVGESGSGKSVTAKSIIRLVKPPGKIVGGSIDLCGQPLLQLPEKGMKRIRGREIAIILQNPTTSFNPLFSIGRQMLDSLTAHEHMPRHRAWRQVVDTLEFVGIQDAEVVLRKYPCDFTAGFTQRIAIAMSMLCRPKLIIADEPTTNLGLSVQKVILTSLKQVQRETGAAIIFITHDFGVIAQVSDNIQVMYAGKIVETGPKAGLLLAPRHPYTKGLLTSVPTFQGFKSGNKAQKSIPGFPPDMLNLPKGCAFAPRCARRTQRCREAIPPLMALEQGRKLACFNPEPENSDGKHPNG